MPYPSREGDKDVFIEAVQRVAGRKALDAIVAARCGSEISIPRVPRVDHWLVQAVGLEKATLICKELAVYDANNRPIAFRCYIPFSKDASALGKLKLKLFEEARVLILEGYAVQEVINRVGLSERTIKRLKSELRSEGLLPRNVRGRSDR